MIHLMQKLDSMTPWHSLRTYETAQEAMYAAYRFANEREPDARYPQYSVQGRQF